MNMMFIPNNSKSGIVTAALLFASAVAPLRAQETELSSQQQHLSYYAANYDEARQKFRDAFTELKTKEHEASLMSMPVPSTRDHDLFIDSLYLPAIHKKRKLMIILSGIHGIEGYVGSALQIFFVKEILPLIKRDEMGLLMVHGVNPFGFKNFRRVTEENVDLNRNFLASAGDFVDNNAGYAKFNEYLNPTSKAALSGTDYWLRHVKMGWLVVKNGMDVMKQVVMQGQREFPDGIFYGGNRPVPNKALLESIIQSVARDYEDLFLIDLHTGYGRPGQLHLFRPVPQDPVTQKRLEHFFEGHPIDWAVTNTKYYKASGDVGSFFENDLMADKRRTMMVLEYGTTGNLDALGSMNSLYALRMENQGFRYGYETTRDQQAIENNFRENFYPQSPSFRLGVIKLSRPVLLNAATRYVAE
jgi:hypothetical protein